MFKIKNHYNSRLRDCTFFSYFQISLCGLPLGGNFSFLKVENINVLYGKFLNEGIVDLRHVLLQIRRSLYLMVFIVSNRGKFFFVNNFINKDYDEFLLKFKILGHFFFNSPWEGGIISNRRAFYFEICKFFYLLDKVKLLDSKADPIIRKKKLFLGVRLMRRNPNFIFISNMEKCYYASLEVSRLRIPGSLTMKINENPSISFFPVFGDCFSLMSSRIFCEIFLSGIISGYFKEIMFFFNLIVYYRKKRFYNVLKKNEL